MKYLLLALLCVEVTCLAQGAPPTTEAGFVSEYRAAVASQDAERLGALTYQAGMSDEDKAAAKRIRKMMLDHSSEVEEVTLKPLPANMPTEEIVRGRKIEMTHPPVGIIETKYRSEASGMKASATPWTIVDGAYYLVGSKSTDLDWQGPPDRNIGFLLMGTGLEDLKIQVQWNASGVTQTRVFEEPSSTFWGQHIDSIRVTSESDESDVTMSVVESGTAIYTSAPLKGKGTIEYRRDG